MIGDPSGRDTLREALSAEQVKKNFETYIEQAKLLLNTEKLEIRYNHEWLEKIDAKKMMELASHYTVQQMLERDMFEKRIKDGNPISVVEFLYPLLVGYDSVILDVDCELGGNDQYFNMLAGRTLQKAYGKRDKFVLTTKLIEGTDGRKMSKSYENCIYLTDAPNEMYGRLMTIRDDLIPTYMECCTDIPMKDVQEAEKAIKNGSTNPKELKMRLAREIVTLYHGKDAAVHAEQHFESVFKDKGVPDDVQEVSVKSGTSLIDVLVSEKIVSSKSEARRLIEQNAVKKDDTVITRVDAKAEEGIYKVGKRKFLKIKKGK